MSHADLLDAVWAAVPPEAQPERFAQRRAWLPERLAPGERVLDLGCGAGEFAAALAGPVVAVDAAPEAVRRARARGVEARLVALDGPLPFAEAEFDVAWLGETLEHLV